MKVLGKHEEVHMQSVSGFEKMLVEQFSKVPFHLPRSVRQWLGDNAWWIVVVGVVLSVLGVIGALQALFWAQNIATMYGVIVPRSAMADVSLWVSLAVFVVTIILEIRAIAPLRSKQKSGWDLIFLATLISFAGSIVTGVLGGSIIGTLLGVIIGGAIAGFFLYETRGEFSKEAPNKATKSAV